MREEIKHKWEITSTYHKESGRTNYIISFEGDTISETFPNIDLMGKALTNSMLTARTIDTLREDGA